MYLFASKIITTPSSLGENSSGTTDAKIFYVRFLNFPNISSVNFK